MNNKSLNDLFETISSDERKNNLEKLIAEDLKAIIGGYLKVPDNILDTKKSIWDYGADSIIFMQLAKIISKKYNIRVSPADFVNVDTIVAIAEKLILEHDTKLLEYYFGSDDKHMDVIDNKDGCEKNSLSKDIILKGISKKYNINLSYEEINLDDIDQLIALLEKNYKNKIQDHYRINKKNSEFRHEQLPSLESGEKPLDGVNKSLLNGDVAIIGVSAVFPDASNPEEFWDNLINKKNSIREIPSQRWDWRHYYTSEKDFLEESNKTVSKWGAFVDHIDHFDPLFFKISPKEAETIDPQERVVLQETYHAIEDAGLQIGCLAGSKTGVFIGYEYSGYLEYCKRVYGEQALTGSSNPSYYLANRVSYTFDFRGPSEAINLGCASSAASMSRAYYSLINQESDVAIAGGVCFNLIPDDYILANELLSPDGTCRVFDEHANGYTKGEGCGVILLKRLEDAERDGDRIYTVIKSCFQNNRGHAQSISDLNPDTFRDVIKDCHQRSHISPDTINYIEVDGYSTKWGDSLEYEAIKHVFTDVERGANNKWCGLGSLKGNIGHLEPASGIASVIKVALSMVHKQFPATISCETINEHIDIQADSHPLYLMQENTHFDKLRQYTSEPIRAGINSFTDSGVNVHILLEEYMGQSNANKNELEKHYDPSLILLSARTENQLKIIANNLKNYLIKRKSKKEYNLSNIAYTLQVGRDAMNCRLAMFVNDFEELVECLSSYVEESNIGKVKTKFSIYTGNVNKNNFELNEFFSGDDNSVLQLLLEERKLKKLAIYWVLGGEVSWGSLYDKKNPHRLPLPVYPFESKSYWISGINESSVDIHPSIAKKNTKIDVKTSDTIEEKLEKIWVKVLGLEEINIHDNFFELGGHSLMGVRILNEIKKILNVDIPMRDLFQYATIAELSSYLESGDQAQSVLGMVKSKSDTELLPLSFSQEKFWLLEKLNEGAGAYTVAQFFELQQPVDLDRFVRGIDHIVERQSSLRARFEIVNGIPYQKITAELKPLIIYKEALNKAELDNIIIEEDVYQFNLEVGPLFRFIFIRCAGGRVVFGISMHHIICDEWSVGILYKEALLNYNNQQLPELPFQYTDFAYSQRCWLEENKLTDQIAWWEGNYKNSQSLMLPRDFTKENQAHWESEYLLCELDEKISRGVDKLIKNSLISRSTPFLSALQILINQWVKQEAFLIHVVTTTRPAGTENLIGLFVNNLPLSFDLSDKNVSVESLLSETKNILLNANEFSNIPAQVKGIGSDRIQTVVMFNYISSLDFEEDRDESLNLNITPYLSQEKNKTYSQAEILFSIYEESSGVIGVHITYAKELYRPETIELLFEQYQSLLVWLLENQTNKLDAAPPLQVLDTYSADWSKRFSSREDVYPLSFEQQSLWIENQMLERGESDPYIEITSLLIKGSLDVSGLDQAFAATLKKYPAFRSKFTYVDAISVQLIPEGIASITSPNYQDCLYGYYHDLSSQGKDSDRYCELFEDYLSGPLPLSLSPLANYCLFKLGEESFQMFIRIHHIIIDDIGQFILLKSIIEFYQAWLNSSLTLDNVVPEYRSVSRVLSRRQMQLNDNKAIAYWEEIFSNDLPVIEIPQDRSHTKQSAKEGGVIIEELNGEDFKQLKHISKSQRATPYVVLLSVLNLLFFKLSGTKRIAISTGMDVRDKETREEGGYFVNTLPLITDLDEQSQTFNDLVGSLKKTLKSLSKFRHFPFSEVVKLSGIDRNFRYNPLSRFGATYTHVKTYMEVVDGCEFSFQPVRSSGSPYDFSVVFVDHGDRLSAEFNYSKDIFDHQTAQRMVDQFSLLLQQILKQKNQKLSDLTLLTSIEKQKILIDWNGVQIEYPQEQCIHQLFEMQAKKTPNTIAAVFEGKSLSYGELDAKANQLAHYLIEQGASQEIRVGLCLERSLEMIIAIIGVLKAGGAYVPLDPNIPQERLQFILDDAKISLLLTQTGIEEIIVNSSVHTVFLDKKNQLSSFSEDNISVISSPEQTAYIIYTSGTTGQPKGVMVSHANVGRLFESTDALYGFNEQDVWTLFHSYAFDFSVWELWGALLYGARLVIVSHATSQDTEAFYQLLIDEQVTVLNQTPSAFRQLITVDQRRSDDRELALRYVIFGGEALDIPMLAPWFSRHGDENPCVVNMYGITETTVHVTHRVIKESDVVSSSSVIGRPLPDLQLYIVDEQLQLLPIGVVGEMYIGGAGVSQGYLKRPELTKERFIPHPFSDRSGARLYRTGDLARYLPDGQIEYIGRVDDQVKIRGFRIELGEVEQQLNQHISVQLSAVVIREDNGNQQLIAYYVLDENKSADVASLKKHLLKNLPDYMVPLVFFEMDVIPLTSNGKVDRKNLQKININIQSGRDYSPPRNKTEEKLVEVWQGALNLEKISINDNFFELGGHSLMGVRILNGIKKKLDTNITMRDLFQYATIAELSSYIEENEHAQSILGMVKADTNLLPLSFSQEKFWLLENLNTGSGVYTVTQFFELHRSINLDNFINSFNVVIERQASLRTTFEIVGGVPYQKIMPELKPLIIYRSASDKKILNKTILEEYAYQFDLIKGPLFRFIVIHYADNRVVFGISMHHIICDEWSVGILYKEALLDYNNQQLPELPFQYVDFAYSQRLCLEEDKLTDQIAWWENNYKNAQPLNLPRDFTKENQTHWKSGNLTCELDKKISQKIDVFIKGSFISRSTPYLSALQILIHQWAKQETFLIHVATTSRPAGTEDLIGLFVNNLPLSFDLSNQHISVDSLLNQTKDILLNANECSNIPTQVKGVGSDRIQTSVMFNYISGLDFEELGGENLELSITPYLVQGRNETYSQAEILFSIYEESSGKISVHITYAKELYRVETIELLLEHYQVLLNWLLDNQAASLDAVPNIKVLDSYSCDWSERFFDRQDVYPLSIEQQALWMEHQLLKEGESDPYIETTSLRIKGDLDVKILDQSFAAMLKKYPAFRSRFSYSNTIPVQFVLDQIAEVNLPNHHSCRYGWYYDILNEGEESNKYQELLNNYTNRPLSISEAPLIDYCIFRLNEDTFQMLIRIHHIILDDVTQFILLKSIIKFFHDLSEGELEFEKMIPQKRSTSHVLDRRSEQINNKEAIKYWAQAFLQDLPTVDLPKNYSCSKNTAVNNGLIIKTIDKESFKQLKYLAKSLRATPYVVVLSVLNLLFFKLSGANRIPISIAMDIRDKETRQEVGYFINTLPLITNFNMPSQSFTELVTSVKQTLKQLSKLRHFPFSEVVKLSGIQRDSEKNPLSRFGATYTRMQEYVENVHGCEFSVQPVRSHGSPYDFGVVFVEHKNTLNTEFNYNQDIFEHDSAQRMVEKFNLLLQQVLNDSDQLIGDLTILNDKEKQQLLVDWNTTEVNYPQGNCVHQLFDAQVKATPNAIAVVYEDQQLSYRELDKKSTILAKYLQSRGVKPDMLVALYIDRSIEMVVCLLGILKSGAAYIPLAPDSPKERFGYMLDDSGATILLSQSLLSNQIKSLVRNTVTVVNLDNDWQAIEAISKSQKILNNSVQADNLAYVIYTSGSTGKPKGVMIEHKAIANRLLWMQETYHLDASDRVLQKTPFTFDVSVWEFFWPLMTGAQLIIAKPGGHQDVMYLRDLIVEKAITTLHFVPSMLSVFLSNENQVLNNVLKRVFCSGEALSAELVQRYFNQLEVPLHNLYGPTEAAVDVTYWPCVEKAGGIVVPIGRPVANTQIYILDTQRNLLPAGVTGELYIAGAQLARGYLNRSDLTAEKFIDNPFQSGTKMYQSGDLARYLSDGSIEYIGRIDDQVKMRGFRIELGEIESCLNQHLSIQSNVVMIKEYNDDKQLIAYYVSEKGQSVDSSDLKDHLLSDLPDYMIPAAFVELNEIPLTSNGKVDRKTLREQDVDIQSKQRYVAPRNFVEEKLAIIWQSLLNKETIGIYDNFFELGGHSLLAMQFSIKLEKELSLPNISVGSLFQYPTISALSEIFSTQSKVIKTSFIELQALGNQPPLFVMPGMVGFSEGYTELAMAMGKSRPIYGLQMQGVCKGEEPLHTIEEIAKYNIDLIREKQKEGPYSLLGHSFGGIVAYEMTRQLEEQGELVSEVIILDIDPMALSAPIQDDFTEIEVMLFLLGSSLKEKDFDQSNIEGVYQKLLALSTITERISYVTAIFHQYEVPIDNEIIKNQLALYHANSKIHYCPKDKIKQEIVLVKAKDNKEWNNQDDCLGWSSYAGKISVLTVPGSHSSIILEPNVSVLTKALREFIKDNE